MRYFTFFILIIVLISFTTCMTVETEIARKSLISLPKTGQSQSYYSTDDGDLQSGVSCPNPRFVDNKDGTITDYLTGLMWECSLSAGQLNWTSAVDYCKNLKLAGHSDWHLPNINELNSLMNYGVENQAAWLNSQGFNNIKDATYWSSTTIESKTGYAWIVRGDTLSHSGKNSNRHLLAVRSGQLKHLIDLANTGQIKSYHLYDDGDLQKGLSCKYPRFVDNNDGTITDTLTGLMWERTPSAEKLDWISALKYCKKLKLAGYSDWRLPNINELKSLVDYGLEIPALWLILQGFGYIQKAFYWSSTTYASNIDKAWYVWFLFGYLNYDDKTSKNYILAVR